MNCLSCGKPLTAILDFDGSVIGVAEAYCIIQPAKPGERPIHLGYKCNECVHGKGNKMKPIKPHPGEDYAFDLATDHHSIIQKLNETIKVLNSVVEELKKIKEEQK